MAREMKDSGIEWIGKIPERWELRKGKNLYDITTGKLDANAETQKGEYPFFTCSMRPKRISTYSFDCEALLVAGNGLVGFTQYYSGKFDAYQRTYVLSNFRDCDPIFLKHYVSNNLSIEVEPKSIGSVISFIKLGDLQNFNVSLPPIDEQNRIAIFLDTQCALIDSVIEKTRAAIEEYKKLKQAVITQAVTKGIRPNREMKDSGIEWVGYMPLEWDSINPKALFSVRKDKAQVGERQLTASQQHGVIYQDEYMELTGNKVVTVEKDFDILKHVEIGDFVISMRSFQGGLEYSSKSGSISSAYVMLIPNHKHVFSRFYRWLLKSSVYIKALQSTTNMVRDGQAMRFANFIKVRLISVPMEEQREIADYLDEKTAAIDSLIQKKEQLITELEAYKKSLIYEYVTGKKEVSDHETIAFSTDLQVALLICKILKSTNIKGRIHLQKVIFALDILLNLFEETQYYRYPHGPYDLQIEKYESILVNQGWINISKIHGHIKYNKTDRFNDFEKLYLEVFETNDAEIQSICSLFNVGRTSKAEKMATVLASWNDFLIDGIAPTDDMIINDIVTNWTVNKANIAEKTWREELRQLKEKQLVPKGYGKHTLKKEQDSYAH